MREQMDKYGKDLYIDPACSETSIDPVNHCNMFGIGQNCRGCYNTCEGALLYKEDFAAEYAVVVSLISFMNRCFSPGHGDDWSTALTIYLQHYVFKQVV